MMSGGSEIEDDMHGSGSWCWRSGAEVIIVTSSFIRVAWMEGMAFDHR